MAIARPSRAGWQHVTAVNVYPATRQPLQKKQCQLEVGRLISGNRSDMGQRVRNAFSTDPPLDPQVTDAGYRKQFRIGIYTHDKGKRRCESPLVFAGLASLVEALALNRGLCR